MYSVSNRELFERFQQRGVMRDEKIKLAQMCRTGWKQ